MACVTTFVGMSRLSREKVVADLDADVVDDADEADGGEWAGPRTLARPTAFSSHTSAVRIAMPRDDGRGGAGAARSARRGGMPGSAADTIARRESADAASMAERMRDKVLAHLERSTQLSEHAASKATSANKQYTSVMGEIASGYDLEELPEATLAAATERCNEDPRCQGFSFAAAIPDTRRALRVVLKTSRIASPKPGHWSWIRPIQAEARTRVDPHAHVRGAAGGAAAGGGAAAAADGRRDVTLVTQTSVDRLWMLKKLCDVWPGPVSAAVFVVGNQMADASVELERSRCAKQGHVAYIQGRSSDHYPVNALRNKAREWVSTSHWLVTDVDLWPSDGTYDVLLRLLDEDWAKDARTAVVVPAFATRHKELKRMPSTLSGLARCIGKRECYAFKGYPGAIPAHHLTTNYPYWWHETTIKSRPVEAYKVPCFDTMVYEPYVMVPAAKSTPLFDERFTGAPRARREGVRAGALRRGGRARRRERAGLTTPLGRRARPPRRLRLRLRRTLPSFRRAPQRTTRVRQE